MRLVLMLTTTLFLGACAPQAGLQPWLDAGVQAARDQGLSQPATMATGIRQLLDLSSLRASAALAAPGGYAAAGFKLSLPPALQPVANTLNKVGLGSYVSRLETAMNRGAEQAAAEALPVFQQAIREMSISDALGIVAGGESAASQYFRAQTEASLRARYQPILRRNLESTGYYSQYQSALDKYKRLPLAKKPDLDIESQLLEQSLNALFGRMAAEEKLIRAAPLARGSELIGTVFGPKR